MSALRWGTLGHGVVLSSGRHEAQHHHHRHHHHVTLSVAPTSQTVLLAELVLSYTHDLLKKRSSTQHLVPKVHSYRGGCDTTRHGRRWQ